MPQERPARTGFRRRLPLELRPEELALLERQERRFASKRDTLVAGLEALERLAELEDERETLATERERALARTAELERQANRLESALAKGKQETGKKKSTQAASERRHGQLRRTAEDTADELRQALERSQAERSELLAELDELEPRALDALFCQRCDSWVEADRWASQQQGEREYVQCPNCGFEPGGPLTKSSIFGYRER
jgi:RNase P subunit RPR2